MTKMKIWLFLRRKAKNKLHLIQKLIKQVIKIENVT